MVDFATYPSLRRDPEGLLFRTRTGLGPLYASRDESQEDRNLNAIRIDYYLFGPGKDPSPGGSLTRLRDALVSGSGLNGVRVAVPIGSLCGTPLSRLGSRAAESFPEPFLWEIESEAHGSHRPFARMVQRAWVALSILDSGLPAPPENEVIASYQRALHNPAPKTGPELADKFVSGSGLNGFRYWLASQEIPPPLTKEVWARSGGYTGRDIAGMAGAFSSAKRREVLRRLTELGVIRQVKTRNSQNRYRYRSNRVRVLASVRRRDRSYATAIHRWRVDRAARSFASGRALANPPSTPSPSGPSGFPSDPRLSPYVREFFDQLTRLIPDLLAEGWLEDHPELPGVSRNYMDELRATVDGRVVRLRDLAKRWMRGKRRLRSDTHWIVPVADVMHFANTDLESLPIIQGDEAFAIKWLTGEFGKR